MPRIILTLALTLACFAAPARADLTCAQACKQAQAACAKECAGRPRAGFCKRACKSGRVRRSCIRLCKQNGVPTLSE